MSEPVFVNGAWILTAAPVGGNMLDYWECTAGSGTYGADNTPFDAVNNKTIFVPDDDRYSDSLDVTLSADSAFTAHFKPAKIILGSGVRITTYDPATPMFNLGYSRLPSQSEVIREGARALLYFEFKLPHGVADNGTGAITGRVNLYKGNSTDASARFFSDTYSNTSWPSNDGYCIYAKIPSMPYIEGFTASVSLNNGPAVTRYYSLEGLVLNDALSKVREKAMSGLNSVLDYCKSSANYTSVKRQLASVYDAAVEVIKTAEQSEDITSAANVAVGQMTALISGAENAGLITVAAAVEKFTVSGDYVVEPTLMRLPEGSNAGEAVLALLEAFYPDEETPYRYTGAYLQSVWDPSYENDNQNHDGYLSEFDEGATSGWMYSVNNVFPGDSLRFYTLHDGDVLRVQYTSAGTGADLGGGLGSGNTVRANKDALTRRIAEIKAAETQSSYSGYNAAMQTLKKLAATQTEVNTALAGLYPADTGERNVYSGYGGVVVLSDARGNYTVMATEPGYVINAVWVDGVKLADTYGKASYTTKTAPARSIFASFIYNANP